MASSEAGAHVSAFFLMGATLSAVGLFGYVRAVVNLIRRQELNHARHKPTFAGCGPDLLNLFGSVVIALLGSLIAGMASGV